MREMLGLRGESEGDEEEGEEVFKVAYCGGCGFNLLIQIKRNQKISVDLVCRSFLLTFFNKAHNMWQI